MPSTNLTFASRDEHRAWLQSQATLPQGFRVGATTFAFTPVEVPKPAKMALSLIVLDEPTPDFAAVFTRNAFPGAPVLIGRRRLQEPRLGAIVVNNKISNVCAPGGEAIAEHFCARTATLLGMSAGEVWPGSTGIIGWTLPLEAMVAALPDAIGALSPRSALPAAEGIMTTDLYPKIRRATSGEGSIVGFAKGAGMIEPNMATMLVYLLTDFIVPRGRLRSALQAAVNRSFNRISIDSDTSTSDTVVAASSGRVPVSDVAEFENALETVCRDLAEDVVRNGEGVRHVIRVRVTGAPDEPLAHGLGKAIVNAPLFKCAVAGNDPNVGRLVQAIGKYLGSFAQECDEGEARLVTSSAAGARPRASSGPTRKDAPTVDVSRMTLRLGGVGIFSDGVFRLDPSKEHQLVEHLKGAELYASAQPVDGVFSPPVDFPPHERSVEVDVDLGLGDAAATVLGADLTHEYVSENADYRS